MLITKNLQQVKRIQKTVDVREAFNLWDIIKSNYDLREHLAIMDNFAHDIDLAFLIRKYYDDLTNNIHILENLMLKYSIKGPDQGHPIGQWVGNSEVMRDELISLDMLLYIQAQIENMFRVIRTCFTNEEIRAKIKRMLLSTIRQADVFYKYLKIKGWVETPPLFPNIPNTTKETITCAEAGHLWDHVTYRYDNLRQTQLYYALANDRDLKFILQNGIELLQKQIDILERECYLFGIQLPKKPSLTTLIPASSEIFNDDEIYRNILIGFQGAAILHSDALKQCTFNDRVRGIFKKMLLKEIQYFDLFIKYGKAKGWVNPIPNYRQ